MKAYRLVMNLEIIAPFIMVAMINEVKNNSLPTIGPNIKDHGKLVIVRDITNV